MRFSTSLFSILSIGLLVSGCSGSGETTQNGEVNVDADGTVHVETSEGTATTANKVPSDWPSDAPAYPGADVQYSASANVEAGQQAALVLTTKDTAEQVVEYYKETLTGNGWSMTSTMQGGDSTLMSAEKGDRAVSIVIGSSEGETTVTLGVATK